MTSQVYSIVPDKEMATMIRWQKFFLWGLVIIFFFPICATVILWFIMSLFGGILGKLIKWLSKPNMNLGKE